LVDAHCLDARKCISYLTIELGASIPRDLREPAGDWLFGCDVCQEVCPWNHRAPIAAVQALRPLPGMNPVELEGFFALSEAAFRARLRGTPVWRAKRAGLLRNAAIVLGNRPHEAAIPGLVRGLNDAEPMVRGACAWALGRYPVEPARTALGQRIAVEADAEVRGEIESSLRDLGES
jgi:epoxyqueuosine reductase